MGVLRREMKDLINSRCVVREKRTTVVSVE